MKYFNENALHKITKHRWACAMQYLHLTETCRTVTETYKNDDGVENNYVVLWSENGIQLIFS